MRDALSGANCGGHGLAGCDAFASAVVKGDAESNGCVAGEVKPPQRLPQF